MQKTVRSFSFQTFLLLLLCSFSGFFFAFIVTEYWPKIQQTDISAEFPFSTAFFYFFCWFAYIMQGNSLLLLSGYSKKALYKTAVPLFWGQFTLGILWLGFFFGLKLFGLALFEIFLSFIFLLISFSFFRAIQIKAAFLLVPALLLLAVMGLLNAWFFLV